MKLLFVLTFKGSLKKWYDEGIANREMEIPMEYLRRGIFSHIKVYTYSSNDESYLQHLNFEPELLNRVELIGPDLASKGIIDHLMHSLNFKKIRAAVKDGAVISKTNQINGCWTSLLAQLAGSKMYLRCGYILSRRLYKNRHFLKGTVALLLEIIAFNLADIASVTTKDAQTYIKKITFWRRNKIFVAPTYVNTTLFCPSKEPKPDSSRVIFVGRLEPQKNIMALLKACKMADFSLIVVGRGGLEQAMIEESKSLGLHLTHYPSLQNEDIAKLYNQVRYFILPSLHEGLPKVLIEAMSAGMICIGTPTSGITDLLQPEVTGLLSDDFTSDSIARTLIKAKTDPDADNWAKAARLWVLNHHSISHYIEREYEHILKILPIKS